MSKIDQLYRSLFVILMGWDQCWQCNVASHAEDQTEQRCC